jgi:hypothetical protein
LTRWNLYRVQTNWLYIFTLVHKEPEFSLSLYLTSKIDILICLGSRSSWIGHVEPCLYAYFSSQEWGLSHRCKVWKALSSCMLLSLFLLHGLLISKQSWRWQDLLACTCIWAQNTVYMYMLENLLDIAYVENCIHLNTMHIRYACKVAASIPIWEPYQHSIKIPISRNHGTQGAWVMFPAK